MTAHTVLHRSCCEFILKKAKGPRDQRYCRVERESLERKQKTINFVVINENSLFISAGVPRHRLAEMVCKNAM